jgi:16S rRNA A1518/A1519 N6-dimethyltransferase RsmA/KsgA/DIM1 with predicted DNA glycosylase/AP lyase activity
MTPGEKSFFFSLTKRVFAFRRKQLASSLGRVPELAGMNQDEARTLLGRNGVDAKARPEDLGAAEWCGLAKALAGR